MKIVVSPAKSLDYKSELPTKDYTQPIFFKEIKQVHSVLESLSPKELSDLMGISDKLANLNWNRNQEFSQPFTPENARAAVYAFSGDVYTGLDAYSLSKDKIPYLQDTLRILSGLYGILKPLDLIQPYRLEMGTKLPIDKAENLYAFWKDKVTKALNDELEQGELLVNLASQEYFKAIDTKRIKTEIITPIFKDWKNDKLKIISFYAKKARGMMVRYIVDNNADTLDKLKGFNLDGYAYSERHTEKENEPVFIR